MWVLFASQLLILFWEATEVPEPHPCSYLPTGLALAEDRAPLFPSVLGWLLIYQDPWSPNLILAT